MNPLVHVGDVGTQFILTVVNALGAVQSLVGATFLQFTFSHSSGTAFVVVPSFVTNGADGLLMWTTTATITFQQAGTWQVQGLMSIPAGMFHANAVSFTVYPNLP